MCLCSSIIRFAAGRISYTEPEQAMCFMAGANAIFTVRLPCHSSRTAP